MTSAEADANVRLWTKANAEYSDAAARESWRKAEIEWGVWGVREDELGVLGELAGLDVVDLGCGTAYLTAWLARRGARVVGVDPTRAQLETARRMQAEFELEFPLVEAPAEQVPLPDGAFDLAVSEYGASIWADPYLWIPEAARLLRSGGRLVFLRSSTLVILCSPDAGQADERLHRAQFGMHRFQWPDGDGATEYHLAHGDWIALLRAGAFEIERLVEIQAPEDAEMHRYYDYVTAEWGQRWPAEKIWVACKRR